MELILLGLSVGLLLLHGLALVWLWQLRRKMNIPADMAGAGDQVPSAGEALPSDPESWYVSDAEQAQQERELMKESDKRAMNSKHGFIGQPWIKR